MTARGDRRVFLIMNGIAVLFMLSAAAIVWTVEPLTTNWGFAAAVLVIVGATLAVGSYPFYRRFMRAEIAGRRDRLSGKRGR